MFRFLKFGHWPFNNNLLLQTNLSLMPSGIILNLHSKSKLIIQIFFPIAIKKDIVCGDNQIIFDVVLLNTEDTEVRKIILVSILSVYIPPH